MRTGYSQERELRRVLQKAGYVLHKSPRAVSPDNFGGYYHFVNAESEAAFDEYIAKCKELSLYDTGVSAAYGDKLITLSTCEYSQTNGRMVVVAKKNCLPFGGGGRR